MKNHAKLFFSYKASEMKPMNHLLKRLIDEQKGQIKGGIHHKTQVLFAYNTNHIEGSQLSKEHTEQIYTTKSLFLEDTDSKVIKTDDLIETLNHFKCFDYLLTIAKETLTEKHIKELHRLLKRNTSMEEIQTIQLGNIR
jgi:hypothetical protein